jgi:alginate O-acetyltransferase complex protein AlgI
MLFNSLQFLYFFLPITYLVFWKLTSKRQRYVWLTITGYVFYSFWNWKFCGLMALSTIVSYLAGLGFLKWESPRRRKLCLVLPIIFDLALLGFFKYANFTLASIRSLSESLHFPMHVANLDIILPIGISFYTFHTITYIVDSYRRVVRPTRNFFEFSCYVSLFSQLVAGPIVRFRQIENDLEQIDQHQRGALLGRGWSFFTIGMIKKVLVADSIAVIVDPALLHWETLSSQGAWLCMLGYTYQLYFDFSGYSDMAVGLGLMFGLRLPQNFNSPYKAVDPSDFWRRWHISLSSVLRDYLYKPLGGSRNGEVKTYRNIMITMLLGGLWHGANWTFVAWGGYHGVLLGLSRAGAARLVHVPQWLRAGGTFLLVVIGWVLFRARSFGMATGLFRRMFSPAGGSMPVGWPLLMLVLVLAAVLAHAGPNTFELSHQWNKPATVCFALLFAACLAVIYGGRQLPFLYFQF